MKKLCAFIAVFGMLTLGVKTFVIAQEKTDETAATEATIDSVAPDQAESTAIVSEETNTNEVADEGAGGLHKKIKELFIKGGPLYMSFILLTLIFGLAIVIERVIYLNSATTNTMKLLESVEKAMETGGIEAAKDLCRDTRGPVASIFYQGLLKYDEGVDMVEKSVLAYGSVQVGQLEKNLSWISLFISLAPMLGFLGTVIGMIIAFQQIEAAGDVSAQLVAGGIQIALITTVFGLVAAIILQVFYNYLVSKIDSLTNSMEDASISFMDILVKFNIKRK